MDPVMARLIDVRPDFDPHAWITQLPPMDLYDALLFQIVGQQLSVAATRRALQRIRALSGGHNVVRRVAATASADKLRPYSIEHRCTSVARITWIR